MLLNVPGMEFDPVEHRYTLDGVEQLSVTTVLKHEGLGINYGHVDPAVLAAAGHRGTQVHHAVALYELGLDWREETEARFWPYMECYLRWRATATFSPVYIEQPVLSRTYGYVGTLDLWGPLADHYALIDAKTRDLDECDGFQTAAYQAALIETYREVHGVEAPDAMYETRRYGLRLFDDGQPAHLEPFASPHDINVFRSAVSLCALRNRMGRPSPFLNEEEKEEWKQRYEFPKSTRRMAHRSPKSRA